MGKPLDGPVCLNHPDRLAVAHCSVCRRPICRECLIEEDGFKCCSRECLKMAKESTHRVADVQERKRRSESAFPLSRIIKWLIVAALIFAAICYRDKIKAQYNHWFGKNSPTIKQRVEKYNKENVEKDHIRRNKKMNDFEADGL